MQTARIAKNPSSNNNKNASNKIKCLLRSFIKIQYLNGLIHFWNSHLCHIPFRLTGWCQQIIPFFLLARTVFPYAFVQTGRLFTGLYLLLVTMNLLCLLRGFVVLEIRPWTLSYPRHFQESNLIAVRKPDSGAKGRTQIMCFLSFSVKRKFKWYSY